MELTKATMTCNRVIRGPQGNAHPRHAPHGIYPAKGDEHEWIAVAVESDKAWRALVARMGIEADPRFDTVNAHCKTYLVVRDYLRVVSAQLL